GGEGQLRGRAPWTAARRRWGRTRLGRWTQVADEDDAVLVGPPRPALRDAPQRDDGSTRLPSSRLHQDLGEGSAGGGAGEGRQRQALALHLRDGPPGTGGGA